MSKEFKIICNMTQQVLKNYVEIRLAATHDNIVKGDGYVFAQGEFPVLLVAHLDTVHDQLPGKIKYDKKLGALWSPHGIGGDDRCGVYMILQVVKKYNCSVLFCEDEEIGGVGATKFTKSEVAKGLSFNYIIEFDRKGSNDAVFYDCGNKDFEEFITKEFYETAYGSFSDISYLAPALGCAAVNLSCGYYNAHSKKEYVVLDEMEESIAQACKILDRTTEADKFEYIEAPRNYGRYGGYGNYTWWDYGDYGSSQNNGYRSQYEEKYYLIEFVDNEGKEYCDEQWANSVAEAIGKFVIDYPNIPYSQVTTVWDEEALGYGVY